MAINNVSDISLVQPRTEESAKNADKLNVVEPTGANIARKSVEFDPGVKKVEDETSRSASDLPEKSNVLRETQIDTESVNNAIDIINQKVLMKATNLIFEFDDLGDPPIVKVVDKENGEVIREIPPKEMQEIAKAMGDIADSIGSSSGILFDSKI